MRPLVVASQHSLYEAACDCKTITIPLHSLVLHPMFQKDVCLANCSEWFYWLVRYRHFAEGCLVEYIQCEYSVSCTN